MVSPAKMMKISELWVKLSIWEKFHIYFSETIVLVAYGVGTW